MLVALLQEEKLYEWTNDNLEKVLKKIEVSMRTTAFRKRLNAAYTALATKNFHRQQQEPIPRRSFPGIYPFSLPDGEPTFYESTDFNHQHLYDSPIARERQQVPTVLLQSFNKSSRKVEFGLRHDSDREAGPSKQADYYHWPNNARNASKGPETLLYQPLRTSYDSRRNAQYSSRLDSQRDAKEEYNSRDQRVPKTPYDQRGEKYNDLYDASPPRARTREVRVDTSSYNVPKAVAEVTKMYSEDQKFGGGGEYESLDYKLQIFYGLCRRVQLPEIYYNNALPAMLKGMALDHYNDNNLYTRSFQEALKSLRGYFEGVGYYMKSLNTWNAITFTTIAAENPTKSTYDHLQLLIDRLRNVQYGLDPDFRSTKFLHAKLILACQGIPACEYGVSRPPENLGELVNALQSSIKSYEKKLQLQRGPETYFTDRRYHRRNDNRDTRDARTQGRYGSNRIKNRCFVCKKEFCRAWKHTPKEREESKASFVAKIKARNRPNYDRGLFNKTLHQYITEYEGDEDADSDADDIDSTFGPLFTNADAYLHESVDAEFAMDRAPRAG